MIETIKVSSKGQIVIPERIRKELQIKEGTNLVLIEKDNKIILEKEDSFLETIKGIEKEKLAWMSTSFKSMEKIWNNEKDEKTWKKYL